MCTPVVTCCSCRCCEFFCCCGLSQGMSSATSSEPGTSGHSSGTGETAPVYSALFAFPRMFSLYACVPPVSSAVKLWDYVRMCWLVRVVWLGPSVWGIRLQMLAKGLYTLVLMVVADIELRRDVLLTESRKSVCVVFVVESAIGFSGCLLLPLTLSSLPALSLYWNGQSMMPLMCLRCFVKSKRCLPAFCRA
jgi:hypothetical protein